ncbi:hypothetical protein I4U23_022409 [Adineta vaga]|nr:hypothetical protein I4U23_022409 [Adineta vaga]
MNVAEEDETHGPSFIYPCENQVDFAHNIFYYGCQSTDPLLGMWQTSIHVVFPTICILLSNGSLLFRVYRSKSRLRQSLNWRKYRLMIFQLVSIACLYLLLNLPFAIAYIWILVARTPLIFIIGLENEENAILSNSTYASLEMQPRMIRLGKPQIRPIVANEWKELISTFLLKLRIFDVLFEIDLFNDTEKAAYKEQVKLFQSSFWIQRQWFFHSRFDILLMIFLQGLQKSILLFVRKEDYELHEQSNEEAIDQCVHYFPNVNQLTLLDGFSIQTYRSIASDLSRILPLQQLKVLVIESHHFPFLKMIELLFFISNLHTLTFQTMPLFKETKAFMEQNKKFQSILKINSITTVAFREKCTFEKLEIFLMLFPHLQHLVMNIEMEDMESILRSVLDKNTDDLILISLTPTNYYLLIVEQCIPVRN